MLRCPTALRPTAAAPGKAVSAIDARHVRIQHPSLDERAPGRRLAHRGRCVGVTSKPSKPVSRVRVPPSASPLRSATSVRPAHARPIRCIALAQHAACRAPWSHIQPSAPATTRGEEHRRWCSRLMLDRSAASRSLNTLHVARHGRASNRPHQRRHAARSIVAGAAGSCSTDPLHRARSTRCVSRAMVAHPPSARTLTPGHRGATRPRRVLFSGHLLAWPAGPRRGRRQPGRRG